MPLAHLAKLLIEKGLITHDEFMQKLSAERAVYQATLRRMGYVTRVEKSIPLPVRV